MKKTFDNDKYISLQRQSLTKILNETTERIYLEIGGKYFDDYHASRVLSGFEPANKYNIMNSITENKEFILCVSAKSITKRKKRKDNKLLYIDECYRMIELLQKNNDKVSVVITMYKDTPTIEKFVRVLNKLKVPYYKTYSIKGYPDNISQTNGINALLKNDYVPCTEKLVCVIAPGPNSGKFATCISQIFHEYNKGLRPIYRKIETFLIPELSLDHPINLACSAAMIDVSSDDVIDERYYKENGVMLSVDSRDLQAFELLYPTISNYDLKIKSLSDTFINNIYQCIFDMELAKQHAIKEIKRRYKDASIQYSSGKLSEIEFIEISRINNIVNKGEVLSKNEMKSLFHNTLEFWGFDIQSNMCLEELSELMKALLKYKREECEKASDDVKYNVLEELADVHNMIYQMELYFGKDKIDKIRTEKAYRTKLLLEKEILEEKLKKGE